MGNYYANDAVSDCDGKPVSSTGKAEGNTEFVYLPWMQIKTSSGAVTHFNTRGGIYATVLKEPDGSAKNGNNEKEESEKKIRDYPGQKYLATFNVDGELTLIIIGQTGSQSISVVNKPSNNIGNIRLFGYYDNSVTGITKNIPNGCSRNYQFSGGILFLPEEVAVPDNKEYSPFQLVVATLYSPRISATNVEVNYVEEIERDDDDESIFYKDRTYRFEPPSST